VTSDPELRKEILIRLDGKRTDFGWLAVRGKTLEEIKKKLGLDVSNTQFSRALRSLHYNPANKAVELARYHIADDDITDIVSRGYIVTTI
jgi:hypothetical protein